MNATPSDDVEIAIERVERLYERVTGQAAPAADGPYAQIPAERDPAQYVEEQMERLANALGTLGGAPETAAEPVRRSHAFWPPVSVWEAADRHLVYVDLPGVPRSTIRISVASDVIEITGERPPPLDGSSGAQLRFTERLGGAFRRLVPLPPGADLRDLRAEMKDGVLEIRVPRSATPRNIPVT